MRRMRAYSLLEVLVATLLVTVILISALHTTGNALDANQWTMHRSKAALLAHSLMSEIQQVSYLDPDKKSAFGKEPNEAHNTVRSSFDDVDDYDGWNAVPPEDRHGNPMTELAGWRREVTVLHVDPGDLSRELSGDDDRGVKRIQIVISYRGKQLIRLDALQTRTWQELYSSGNDSVAVDTPPL